MVDRKHFRRESVRTTALFFVVFGLIFAALGIFVYQTVSSNLFKSVDEQLGSTWIEVSPEGLRGDDVISESGISASVYDESAVGEHETDITFSRSQSIASTIEDNPQTIFITRSNLGEVTDAAGLYTTYSDFIRDLPFSADTLDQIYAMDHNGHHYRAINHRLEGAGNSADEATYIQIVANVDSEIAILDQFTRTLVAGLVAALIISAAASYLLSRYTLRPIARAWDKQTEFVQNASHELRTPLTVIRTTQELLLTEPNARIVDRFEDITVTIEETDRLARLTEDLLALTAADANEAVLETEEVDIDELIEAAASAYDELASAQEKSLELELSGQTKATVNRDAIRQLLAILLDNALKYTEDGDSITVTTAQSGGSVVVRVTDTGVGISEDDAIRVFDRFFRADRARSRETGGNGLGLSIAQSIVAAHKGTIRMERNDSAGVTVVVELPR